MRLASIVPVLALLLVAPAHAAPPTPVLVDTCGQVVPAKAAAYLAGDLDCSGYGGSDTLTLGKRTSFDLGGFTITTGALNGIRCDDRCTIRNGTVTGAATSGLAVVRSVAENLTLTMDGIFGAVLDGNSVLRGSTIGGTSMIGVHSLNGRKKVTIVDSTITGQRRFGVWAYKPVLEGSTVTGNMIDAECAGDALCADILSSRRPRVEDSTCGRSDNLPGIVAEPGCLGWCVCAED